MRKKIYRNSIETVNLGVILITLILIGLQVLSVYSKCSSCDTASFPTYHLGARMHFRLWRASDYWKKKASATGTDISKQFQELHSSDRLLGTAPLGSANVMIAESFTLPHL